MQAPCESHLIATKKIFHYLKGTLNIGLHHVYCPLTTMTSYWDADWVGSVGADRRSTTSFAVFIGHNHISWGAKKQATISWSIVEAKYISVIDKWLALSNILSSHGQTLLLLSIMSASLCNLLVNFTLLQQKESFTT
jgi:hypothetical protein